jgi:cytochrome bd-type quinol oxidase subunit 2
MFMKKILLTLVIAISYLLPTLMLAGTAAALTCSGDMTNLTAKQQIQCGACGAAGSESSCNPAAAPGTVDDTIKTVINLLSIAVGVVAVIMIIIGGLRYITSAGSPEQAKGARNTILYAIIGLVIVAMAQVIVRFVLKNATNPK